MKVIGRLTIMILFFCVTAYLHAAAKADTMPYDSSRIENFSIWYVVDSINIDRNYLSNQEQIERIRYYLANSPRIDSITIYAWASPEGGSRHNRLLSEGRAESAKAFLLSLSPDPAKFNEGKIRISPESENWAGLLALVLKNYERADRGKVLEILNDKTISNEARKYRLQRLDGGRTWRYLIDNYMPELRAASWVCVWAPAFEPLPAHSVMKDTLICPEQGLAHSYCSSVVSAPVFQDRRTIMALKTNMLYDVASLLNFSVEVPVFKDEISVLYYHQFPWWTWGQADNEFCLRFLSIGAEARWWFARPESVRRRDRLTGHFLGAYAESGKYDFEHKRDICRQGEFWSAGLSYGYSMPVGKRLNLEFSLSAGYASIAFRGYTPSDDYEILWRDPKKVGRAHYVGLTKAQVSLVIPITVKYKVGGER